MVKTTPNMSDYEHSAWQALIDTAGDQRERSRRSSGFTQAVKQRAQGAATRTRTALERVPGAEQALDAVDATMQKAMEGLHTVLVERGLNSVKPVTIFKTFAAEGIEVTSYDDLHQLDLKLCDRSVPRRKERYVALALTEGAASSLMVTGAVVSTTVSGGTTGVVAFSAIVADVTALMVGMGRIVALVAAHYGYDVREPDERIFASGVIAYSSASGSAEKAASLASLSRLTQQMMRRATWKQLQQNQMVNVIQRMFTALGLNLTKRKLAQAVPVVGAVVNGGLNAGIAHKTFERAQQVYRLRFLTEKYGLDPSDWEPQIVDAETVDIPLIDGVLSDELSPDPQSHQNEDDDSNT